MAEFLPFNEDESGNFWDFTDPRKPWGPFDPSDFIDIPFDIADWLAGLPDTYSSHTVKVDDALTVVQSAQSAGVVVVRVRATAPTTIAEDTYVVTLHAVTTGGQEKDFTARLKVKEM